MLSLSGITVVDGPVHPHDDECDVYLGTRRMTCSAPDVNDVVRSQRRTYDFYWCKGNNLIARYGDMGDYGSGMSFVFSEPTIHLAYELAVAEDSPLSKEQRRDLDLAYSFRLEEELERRTNSILRLPVPVIEQLLRDIDVLLRDHRRRRT